MVRRRLLAAGLALGLALTSSRPLRAADDGLQQIGTMMWVVTVAEYTLLVGALGLGGTAALLSALGGDDGDGDLGGDIGFGLLGTTAIFGIGAGYASMEGDWDPRLAGAMHGALWASSGLGAWGYLLGQSIDPASLWPSLLGVLGLGALGALGGAALGGLLVDREDEVWLVYAAPLVSGVAMLATWGALSIAHGGDENGLEESELASSLIAAGTAPLLVAALGVGVVSVLQALR